MNEEFELLDLEFEMPVPPKCLNPLANLVSIVRVVLPDFSQNFLTIFAVTQLQLQSF